mmetsp:Transcript_74393/g.206553  ORF Transcript_74393/g.206553 Transcript_74393/m.206553 type:complete len:248 (-) Transcript_74393:107-850(-)
MKLQPKRCTKRRIAFDGSSVAQARAVFRVSKMSSNNIHGDITSNHDQPNAFCNFAATSASKTISKVTHVDPSSFMTRKLRFMVAYIARVSSSMSLSSSSGSGGVRTTMTRRIITSKSQSGAKGSAQFMPLARSQFDDIKRRGETTNVATPTTSSVAKTRSSLVMLFTRATMASIDGGPSPLSSGRTCGPYLSYAFRFSGSISTSYAFFIALNSSGLPPRSGCNRRDLFLYAFRSSATVASDATSSRS